MNALKLSFILALLAISPAFAAELARDPQPAVVIDPDENPWEIPHAGVLHDRTRPHREMGVQLERALDVAYDELRKVDQSHCCTPPTISIFIWRQDLHTVEIHGTREGITVKLHELSEVCPPRPLPTGPNCPPR